MLKLLFLISRVQMVSGRAGALCASGTIWVGTISLNFTRDVSFDIHGLPWIHLSWSRSYRSYHIWHVLFWSFTVFLYMRTWYTCGENLGGASSKDLTQRRTLRCHVKLARNATLLRPLLAHRLVCHCISQGWVVQVNRRFRAWVATLLAGLPSHSKVCLFSFVRVCTCRWRPSLFHSNHDRPWQVMNMSCEAVISICAEWL